MISVVLIVGFFAAIFEVNAACLRYISATKENVAAIQGVQDRLETLRGMAFTDLTTASKVTTTLTTPSNGADFTLRVTETVTLTNYPSASPTVTFYPSSGRERGSIGHLERRFCLSGDLDDVEGKCPV